MLKTVSSWLLLVLPVLVWAQIEDPVDWTYESQQTAPQTFEVTFRATIEPGWHLYSQFIEPGGPIPTGFFFENKEKVEVVGSAREVGKTVREYDETFDMDLAWFENSVSFVQEVKVIGGAGALSGYLEYMVCNDEKCLPPTTEDFAFNFVVEQSGTPQEATGPQPQAQGATAPPQTETPTTEAPPLDEAAAEPNGILQPVSWRFGHAQNDDGTYTLQFTAEIEEGWKIYGQDVPDGGPIPTGFFPGEAQGYELLGKPAPARAPRTAYDEVFDMEVSYFKKEITFSQRVRFIGDPVPVEGELEFMTCDAERCLPPELVAYAIDVTQAAEVLGPAAGSNTPTQEKGAHHYRIANVDLKAPLATDCEIESEVAQEDSSLWTIFLLGFLGGLIALLTPCVFPMIPLTVSFFTKNSGGAQGIRRAATYGLFIFAIYVILSAPFYFVEGLSGDIFNNISTNVWLNLIFFIIFVVFAFSFFGYYEIALPHRFTNRVSGASRAGGLVGTFFMALTLAIVSFSCTGPILGSLLVGALSSDGGAFQLTVGMGAFGLALALPFTLFALFPRALEKLPRSGSWLNTVKVVLGFVELGLAVKFLSNADLVEHWGLLKREIFFGLWILIGLGLAAYLFGLIRFPHDSPSQPFKVSKTRLALGGLTVAFVVYLFPGLTNTDAANRQLLSGFPPPLFYSIYDKETNCPLGIDCFKDYEEGMAYARKMNKPVMIDFTGWACVNCRRMEENVWVKDEIYNRLKDDYVLISLYVDDRKKLPESDQRTVILRNGTEKRIRTVGDQWSVLEMETFNVNSQPYYVLLSPDERLLTEPVGYTPDEVEYGNFLECGLRAWKKSALTVVAD